MQEFGSVLIAPDVPHKHIPARLAAHRRFARLFQPGRVIFLGGGRFMSFCETKQEK